LFPINVQRNSRRQLEAVSPTAGELPVRAPLTILCLPLLAVPASAEDPGDATRGAAYAQRVCSECHAVLSGEAYSPNPDAPPFQEVADNPERTRLALSVWLQSSHPTMPNIMVAPADRDDVIAYIMSLEGKARRGD
jgi:mono/diheme cytochrome c family protein